MKSIIDKTVADHILFLHAFSGCDTTSALFNQGKMKFINVLPIWRRERQKYEVAKLKFGKSTSKSIKLPIFKTPGKLSR
jgi:hypothetical protein